MCGIWFGLNNQSGHEKIQHRGPDETKELSVGPNKLVFHRLKIHDLVSGSQPFVLENPTETVYCMVNGEIYNYKDIQKKELFELESKSDCEVVIHLYQKYKENFYLFLEGEYAIVLLISRQNRFQVLAIRDHIGVKPLFYSKTKSQFSICSEAKGLTMSKVLEPRRLYKSNWYTDISDFQFGVFNQMDFPKRRFENKIHYTTSNIFETVRDCLTKAVTTRLSADRPIGAFLSGGLDSSIVCALAARELKKTGQKLQTFTIALPNSTDLPYAQLVSNYIGSEHHVVHITEQEALDAIDETIYAIESFDTTTVRASVMQFLLSRWISKNTDIKVLLVGELSDELFNGYLYSHKILDKKELREDAIRLVNEVHYFDGLRTERTTAYHGLEVRLPFSDLNLISQVFSSNYETTFPQEGFEKFLLRKSFDIDILPNEVLWRRKEAFSDACSSKEKSWYQIIQDEIEKRVSDEEFSQRELTTHMCPMTKEQYYYKKVFESRFGKNFNLLPHYWVPKGLSVSNNEPSARAYFDI